MKSPDCSNLDLDALRGALVTNPNGFEFYIVGFSADLNKHHIMVWLANPADLSEEPLGIDWQALADWSIQLQPRLITPPNYSAPDVPSGSSLPSSAHH